MFHFRGHWFPESFCKLNPSMPFCWIPDLCTLSPLGYFILTEVGTFSLSPQAGWVRTFSYPQFNQVKTSESPGLAHTSCDIWTHPAPSLCILSPSRPCPKRLVWSAASGCLASWHWEVPSEPHFLSGFPEYANLLHCCQSGNLKCKFQLLHFRPAKGFIFTG